MKFTLPIALLAVTASAAVFDQDKRYCETEGQSCHTVKRAAEAFSETIRENAGLVTREESSGELSYIARRQLHELALAIAAAHDNPRYFYDSIATPTIADKPSEKRDAEPGWCTQFLGMPCWKRTEKDLPTKVKRGPAPGWCTQFLGMPCWKREEPATPVRRDPEPGWCTQFLGMPCWKREESPAAGNEVAKREPEGCTQANGVPCWNKRDEVTHVPRDVATPVRRDPEPGWCTQFLGMPCWKRDAPVEAREPDRHCSRFAGGSCWKRDGSEVALEEVKRCTSEGQACWKAKRAAVAVVNAIDAGNALRMKRSLDWKREASCSAPDGICTKATRDLHAMYNAARSILEA
ncbi:hypothetical protein VTJ83DRAFT_2451 [Remersonia thermophila]|uniref:Clock-controlled pheromone ccg-4 n=1 Tax=Remersonia thermophila TaxID=72144 RepID=A0ABR4DIZ7_9PEZI